MATSTIQEFKKAVRSPLVLPSGLSIIARRAGIETFLKGGKVPNSLMPVMRKAMQGKRMSAEEAIADVDINEETITDMFALFDVVALATFAEPKLLPVPANEADRSDDALYVDEVEMADKQFIFQWAVGGTSDVEQFREQANQLVASLQQGEAVRDETIQATGDKE